jgi:hypothetical protein
MENTGGRKIKCEAVPRLSYIIPGRREVVINNIPK